MSRSNIGLIEQGIVHLVYVHDGEPATLGNFLQRLLTMDRDSYFWYIVRLDSEKDSLWHWVRQDLLSLPEVTLGGLYGVPIRQIRRSILRYFIEVSPAGWSHIVPNAGQLAHTHTAPHQDPQPAGPRSYVAAGAQEPPYHIKLETLGRSAQWSCDDVEHVYLLDIDGPHDMLWAVDTGEGLRRSFNVYFYHDLDDWDVPGIGTAYQSFMAGHNRFVPPFSHVAVKTRAGDEHYCDWVLVNSDSRQTVHTPLGDYEVVSIYGHYYADQVRAGVIAPNRRRRAHKMGRVLYRRIDGPSAFWYRLTDLQAVIVTLVRIPETKGLEDLFITLLETAK